MSAPQSAHTGEILLHRKERAYKAGFCIIRESLSGLLKYTPLLHPSEDEYYSTLKYDKRKISYLLGRIAAKKALAAQSGIKDLKSTAIDIGIFSFPVVKSKELHNMQVSISHCDEIGLALAFPEEHPLGIDIEKADSDKTEAMKTQMSLREMNMLLDSGLTETTGCTILWTVKEALSKIFRTGLTMDIRLFEIESLHRKESFFECSFAHCGQYKAISLMSGAFICSIVLPKNTSPDLSLFQQSFELVCTGKNL